MSDKSIDKLNEQINKFSEDKFVEKSFDDVKLRVIKEEKYLTEISYEIWDSTLNKYYEESNLNKSVSQVKNPSKEDIVFLNCIYLPIFSARDQLSGITFDIEHLATKGLMKKAIMETNGEGEGLPIASIANICYLNEGTNTEGGYMVPEEFAREVFRVATEAGIVRKYARIIPM